MESKPTAKSCDLLFYEIFFKNSLLKYIMKSLTHKNWIYQCNASLELSLPYYDRTWTKRDV